jgi:hypothetical protein
MVVFVDLDDAFEHGSTLEKPFPQLNPIASEPADLTPSPYSSSVREEPDEGNSNPNRNGFSAALSCYPYVKTDLDNWEIDTLLITPASKYRQRNRASRRSKHPLLPFDNMPAVSCQLGPIPPSTRAGDSPVRE